MRLKRLSVVACGPVWPTLTKAMPWVPQGLDNLAWWVHMAGVPVVAIGGIHKDNILQLRGTGVDGVALVSAIFSAKDIEAECRELKALSEQIIVE